MMSSDDWQRVSRMEAKIRSYNLTPEPKGPEPRLIDEAKWMAEKLREADRDVRRANHHRNLAEREARR